jgi:hypothetical protein
MRLQEPNYEDGLHLRETVSWLVVEAGSYELADGTPLSAGTISTNRLSSQGFRTVTFEDPFADAPAVLTQVQTNNGLDWVITRTDAITGGSFKLTMQEEEALNDGGHLRESVGWLAVGEGSADDGDTLLEAGRSSTRTTDFSPSFSDTPALLAKLSSFNGADPANLRLFDIAATGFSSIVAEERSADLEVDHLREERSWLALEGSSGILEGLPV